MTTVSPTGFQGPAWILVLGRPPDSHYLDHSGLRHLRLATFRLVPPAGRTGKESSATPTLELVFENGEQCLSLLYRESLDGAIQIARTGWQHVLREDVFSDARGRSAGCHQLHLIPCSPPDASGRI